MGCRGTRSRVGTMKYFLNLIRFLVCEILFKINLYKDFCVILFDCFYHAHVPNIEISTVLKKGIRQYNDKAYV